MHVRFALKSDEVSRVRDFRPIQRSSLGANAAAALFMGACLIGICVLRGASAIRATYAVGIHTKYFNGVQVVQNTPSQYVLSFSPSQHDGRLHRLAIRVKPQNLTTRANLSYVALKSE
jgi:hypothetical protein